VWEPKLPERYKAALENNSGQEDEPDYRVATAYNDLGVVKGQIERGEGGMEEGREKEKEGERERYILLQELKSYQA